MFLFLRHLFSTSLDHQIFLSFLFFSFLKNELMRHLQLLLSRLEFFVVSLRCVPGQSHKKSIHT